MKLLKIQAGWSFGEAHHISPLSNETASPACEEWALLIEHLGLPKAIQPVVLETK